MALVGQVVHLSWKHGWLEDWLWMKFLESSLVDALIFKGHVKNDFSPLCLSFFQEQSIGGG